MKYLLNKLKMFVPKKKPAEKKKNETVEEGAEKETDKEGKDAEEATPEPDEQQEIPPTEEKVNFIYFWKNHQNYRFRVILN